MYAYKPFLSKEVIITPLILNKQFSFSGDDFISELSNDIAWVDLFFGQKLTLDEIGNNSINISTGLLNNHYIGQIYNSIKNIYRTHKSNNSFQYFIYPEFYEEWLPLEEKVHRIDNDLYQLGDRVTYLGYVWESAINNNRSTPGTKHWNQLFLEEIEMSIVSISPQLYGEKVFPSSFKLIHGVEEIVDDGEGNLYLGETYVGNIFYSLGLAVLITGGCKKWFKTVHTNYITVEFSSTITIKEHQYKCVIGTNEFKGSLNPTLIDYTQNGIDNYLEFVYNSDFTPYLTTVGLYNEDKELLAVAKLSKPLASSRDIDTTIIIKFDE